MSLIKTCYLVSTVIVVAARACTAGGCLRWGCACWVMWGRTWGACRPRQWGVSSLGRLVTLPVVLGSWRCCRPNLFGQLSSGMSIMDGENTSHSVMTPLFWWVERKGVALPAACVNQQPPAATSAFLLDGIPSYPCRDGGCCPSAWCWSCPLKVLGDHYSPTVSLYY